MSCIVYTIRDDNIYLFKNTKLLTNYLTFDKIKYINNNILNKQNYLYAKYGYRYFSYIIKRLKIEIIHNDKIIFEEEIKRTNTFKLLENNEKKELGIIIIYIYDTISNSLSREKFKEFNICLEKKNIIIKLTIIKRVLNQLIKNFTDLENINNELYNSLILEYEKINLSETNKLLYIKNKNN